MLRSMGWLLLIGGGIALEACARPPTPPIGAEPNTTETSRRAARSGQAIALPLVQVHKSPSCGCCALWVRHLRKAGFTVEVHHQDNLNPLKERLGVPYGKGSCHTAEVGGYVVEGHVPAADIKRLLAQAPAAKGLAVPGMPIGSPGMEVAGGRTEPYTVELIGRDGSTTAFARH